jgi:hypothetical protein
VIVKVGGKYHLGDLRIKREDEDNSKLVLKGVVYDIVN